MPRGAMRALSLDLKNRHREVLLPALVMFVGGFILGFSRRVVVAEPCAAPNGGPTMPVGNSTVRRGRHR